MPAPSSQHDLFGLDLNSNLSHASNQADAHNKPPNQQGSSASDDLLMLSGPNPFIQNIVNQTYAQQQQQPTMNPVAPMGMAMPNPFQNNGFMMPSQPTSMYPTSTNHFSMNPMLNTNTGSQGKLGMFRLLGFLLPFVM